MQPHKNLDFSEEHGVKHYTSREAALADLLPDGAVGAELGVMRGNNALRMIEAASPSKVYLVDPWTKRDARYHNVCEKFKGDTRVVVQRTTALGASYDESLDWYEEDSALGGLAMYDHMVAYDKRLKFGGLAMLDYCRRPSWGVREDRADCLHKFLLHNGNYVCVGCVPYNDTVILRKLMVERSFATRADLYTALPKNGNGLEVGVLIGANAKVLRDVTSPASMTLVDCWDDLFAGYDRHLESVGLDGNAANAEEHVRTTFPTARVIRGFSPAALSCLEDGFFDWAYVDGNHKYEAVYADLCAIKSKMKPSCVIAGHDWSLNKFNSVVAAVLRFASENKDFVLHGLSRERASKSYLLKRG